MAMYLRAFILLAATIFLMLILPSAMSISFNYPSFGPNVGNITYEGDAYSVANIVQLTKNAADSNMTGSKGRATYSHPVHLWDAKSKRLTDFVTHFSFVIKALDPNPNLFGDGMTFFLAPVNSTLPNNSSGRYLGLFSPETALNSSESNQIVAVEFDTFGNTEWEQKENHVGIDINSIISVVNKSWEGDMKNGTVGNAWITYNSSTKTLGVFLSYSKNPVFNGSFSLSHVADLREFLPEWVKIGFSASTGSMFELHTIYSWNFTSSLEIEEKTRTVNFTSSLEVDRNVKKKRTGTGLYIAIGSAVGSISVLAFGTYIVWRRKFRSRESEEDEVVDVSMDDEFEKGTGPKRFTYHELNKATNDFAEAGKLGEGGFGGVYKGLLSDSNTEIAVKKVSRGSKQGRKEYISEVKIISRLRHRNLVQLIGWCHQRGDLLLVYEFMPNGSLDSHLFGKKTSLNWSVRYKIALGLASALLYLHEEWEQCVVHRDIKSSNVMLDSKLNAKLGDFGLARLVDHELGSQTTVLAGTMGYLAPECLTTGKASKESDVYSFGVVALEITCGRKPVDIGQEASKLRLVEWVWDLYGKGELIEALDKRLNDEIDERQMECLMIVGLWCCHPDFEHRPSIRQVINVLNFEAPLPRLPAKLPVPMYYAPPMNMYKFSYTSTSTSTNTGSSSSTNSPCLFDESTKSLLKLEKTTYQLSPKV